jgi:hypothetical protein
MTRRPRPVIQREPDPGLDEANLADGDAEDGSPDLPAFLIEDEPAITALNGAAAH